MSSMDMTGKYETISRRSSEGRPVMPPLFSDVTWADEDEDDWAVCSGPGKLPQMFLRK